MRNILTVSPGIAIFVVITVLLSSAVLWYDASVGDYREPTFYQMAPSGSGQALTEEDQKVKALLKHLYPGLEPTRSDIEQAKSQLYSPRDSGEDRTATPLY